MNGNERPVRAPPCWRYRTCSDGHCDREHPVANYGTQFLSKTNDLKESERDAVTRRRWWTWEEADRWSDHVCSIHQRLRPFGPSPLLWCKTPKKHISTDSSSSLQIDFACPPPLPAPTPSSPYFPNLMHHIIHCKIQQSKMDSSSFNRCNAQQPEMDGSFFNCFDDSTLFDLKNIVQFQSGPISSGWSWRKLLIFAHFGWIFVETKGFQWKWIGFSNGCWVFRIVYQPMINVFSFWMDINLVIRIDAESGYLSLNAGHRRKGSWIIEKWVDIDDSCANKRANNLLFGL